GGGVLNYTISSDAAWVIVSPTSGSSTGAADPIAVQYDAASLVAGSYSATITVSDPAATNDPQIISVSLTINAPPSGQPTILLSAAALAPSATEGSNPPDDSFTVSNSGGGVLNYTIGSDVAWLVVSPTSGSGTGAADPITVQYDAASLTAGTYSATITVSDPAATNDPQIIDVSLTINSASLPPEILLNVSSLAPSAAEGSNPPDDTFTVTNSGGGTLNYSVSADVAWLIVSPTSGSSTGNSDTITVQYDVASMAVGSYSGTITVSDPAAANDPQTISVSLTISASSSGQPVISLSTSSLSPLTTEDASPPDDSFTVSNTGGGTLNYTVSTAWVAGGPASQHHSPDGDADGDAGGPGDGDADDIPAATWLTVSPTSGSSSGEINTITVHYDTAWLADGTYSATITLSDPAAFNNPQVITIFLTVNEAEDGHNQGSGNEGGSGHDEGSGHDNPPGSSSDQPPSPGQNPGVGCGVGFPAFSMVTLCTLVAIRTGRARRRGHR
ncbi:MAG TPA: hypothetical protein VMV94_02245, partial [Phycisphaerae bacterium]|nr:hypothetical protein [Phycisphaerae bacterium]